jgi:hypothetical protein
MPIGVKDYKEYTEISGGSYDIKSSDVRIHVTYTATGAVTINLPTNQLNPTRLDLTIKDAGGNSGANNITVQTEGTEKIDGQDTAIINGDYDAIVLYNDGSNWFIK